ncbi:MAG: hypothetical protein U0414_37640 [Polyangiaceae bacterium]
MMLLALVAGPATAVELRGDHGSASHVTQPQADAKAEVIVLYGANDNSGIDGSLGKIPALSKPPFSAYNSYKLLERKEHELVKGKWVEQVLPDQNTLSVSLQDITTKDDQTRYTVETNIKKPDGSSYLPKLEVSAQKGEYFFVGGPKFKEGVLVIGIRIL